MAKVSIATLKEWYMRGKKPLQEQFWHWMDSYRHKDDMIPISSIDTLQAQLDGKADASTDIIVDASTIESFDPNKQDGYLAGNVFVSYINEASTDPDLDFKKLFIYQCVADAATGESPETHPLKWERIGETMTFTSSTTANGWVGLTSQMYALTGMKDGHTVAVLQTNAVYKYNIVTGNWDYFCELKSTNGGGHVIKTTTETLPQQPNLKIKGLPVTNDDVAEETIIDASLLVARVTGAEQDIADLQATSEANQLVLASIYGYYNFI